MASKYTFDIISSRLGGTRQELISQIPFNVRLACGLHLAVSGLYGARINQEIHKRFLNMGVNLPQLDYDKIIRVAAGVVSRSYKRDAQDLAQELYLFLLSPSEGLEFSKLVQKLESVEVKEGTKGSEEDRQIKALSGYLYTAMLNRAKSICLRDFKKHQKNVLPFSAGGDDEHSSGVDLDRLYIPDTSDASFDAQIDVSTLYQELKRLMVGNPTHTLMLKMIFEDHINLFSGDGTKLLAKKLDVQSSYVSQKVRPAFAIAFLRSLKKINPEIARAFENGEDFKRMKESLEGYLRTKEKKTAHKVLALCANIDRVLASI